MPSGTTLTDRLDVVLRWWQKRAESRLGPAAKVVLVVDREAKQSNLQTNKSFLFSGEIKHSRSAEWEPRRKSPSADPGRFVASLDFRKESNLHAHEAVEW